MFDMVIVAFCRWQGKVVDLEGGGKEIEDSDQIDGGVKSLWGNLFQTKSTYK